MKAATNYLLLTIMIVVVLIYGKGILIPFVFAMLFWLATRLIRIYFDKIPFVRKKIPKWTKNLVICAGIFYSVETLLQILSSGITTLATAYPSYEPNIQLLLGKLNQVNANAYELLQSSLANLDVPNLFKNTAISIAGLLSNTIMIVLYIIFIFIEDTHFGKKLSIAFPNETQYRKILTFLQQAEGSIGVYFRVKTMISAVTATLSYIVFRYVGIEAPEFWALLIFILNYLPSIGSLIGTLVPAIFCLIQFGSITPFLIVLVLIGTIQIIMGSIIEPKILSSTLNISPLLTILALVVWGEIWGVSGMFLSVPITIIMLNIMAQFPETKALAIMCSEKGTV